MSYKYESLWDTLVPTLGWQIIFKLTATWEPTRVMNIWAQPPSGLKQQPENLSIAGSIYIVHMTFSPVPGFVQHCGTHNDI